MKFLESHLTHEKDDGPKGQKLTNDLVYWSKCLKRKRREIDANFWLFLLLPWQRSFGCWYCAGSGVNKIRSSKCRWLLPPSWHSVAPATVLVRGHSGVYHLPWKGLVPGSYAHPYRELTTPQFLYHTLQVWRAGGVSGDVLGWWRRASVGVSRGPIYGDWFANL